MGGVSSALDPARGRGVISVPEGYTTPSFPSLYIPTIDSTIEQRGIFLYEAEAIWHFTLYWTMALLCGLFLICALFASATMILNLTVYRPPLGDPPDYPSRSVSAPTPRPAPRPIHMTTSTGAGTAKPPPIIRKNLRKRRKKRPPLWPVLILPAVSVFVAAVIALISGTVVGFALAAIYSAGGFSMSTSYSTLTSIL
ncbi:hypothetical protein I317_05523 [Kwoniella heveanensis CBS 569]|nr:hypothetical protein I317_05523 [Kwoniella heveanensis CBS 569]